MVSEQYGRYDIQGSASGLVSYNGLAARRLKADVWGASPASEANYGKIAGSGGRQHATMKVVNEAFFVNGKLAGGIENGHVLRYYQAEFAEDFVRDELGYTNNTRLGKAALPDPGWSTLYVAATPQEQLSVATAPLQKVEIELVFDPHWSVVEPPVTQPLPLGEVERVTPKWHW